jgi:hypothetical protein
MIMYGIDVRYIYDSSFFDFLFANFMILLAVPFHFPQYFDLLWQGGSWVIIEIRMQEGFCNSQSSLLDIYLGKY